MITENNGTQEIPKIYIALLEAGMKIHYVGFPHLIAVKMALLGAIEGIDEQLAQNTVVQRKSGIVLPTDMLK